MENLFHEFLRDRNLTELSELIKCSDDILDVIDLTENQHSDILAWCFNPNEGHGQGDAVVKDFLEAAYERGDESIWDNKKFFAYWTPGRIRTTSFGSAFLMREKSVLQDDGLKGRLDLLLIDPRNNFMVCIENKAGARLNQQQLTRYKKAVKDNYLSRPVFKGYDAAFVVLDRKLGSYSDDHIDSLGKEWALLDYAWLEQSAARARLHAARSHHGAQLLLAYCQKQTGWESEAEKRVSALAAKLVMAHGSIIYEIKQRLKLSIADWTPKSIEGWGGELLMFTAMNKQLCDHLVRSRGMAPIVSSLMDSIPELTQGMTEVGRTRFSATVPKALQWIATSDGYWPFYVNLFQESEESETTEPRYILSFVWAPSKLDESKVDCEKLRKYFQSEFPDLKKHESSEYRRIVIARNLKAAEALEKTIELWKKVSTLTLTFKN